MSIDNETKNRLRFEVRDYPLLVWLSGAYATDAQRWDGDDGRRLSLDEWQWWPVSVREAEEAEFARLDALYEKAKESAGKK